MTILKPVEVEKFKIRMYNYVHDDHEPVEPPTYMISNLRRLMRLHELNIEICVQ